MGDKSFPVVSIYEDEQMYALDEHDSELNVMSTNMMILMNQLTIELDEGNLKQRFLLFRIVSLLNVTPDGRYTSVSLLFEFDRTLILASRLRNLCRTKTGN